MKAVGLYLRTLRDDLGMSRGAVAKQLRTDDSQIERIENGQIDTRSSLLFRFVELVQGRLEDIRGLILGEPDSPDLGRNAARDWIAQGKKGTEDIVATIASLTEEERLILARLNPDQRQALLNLARQFLAPDDKHR